MRNFLHLLSLVIISAVASAQTEPPPGLDAPHYEDVVHLLGEEAVNGYVLRYDYGDTVVVRRRNGVETGYAWERIKRVTFRERRALLPAAPRQKRGTGRNRPAPETFTAPPPPPRRFRHEIMVGINLSDGMGDDVVFEFISPRAIGLGANVAYHLMYEYRWLGFGGGLDYALLNNRNRESYLAATGVVTARVGKKRVRPFLRLAGGPAYPVGSFPEGSTVTRRYLTLLLQPSLGFSIGARRDPWRRMHFDLGYRFFDGRVDTETESLEVITRLTQYRRLVLRGGLSF